MNRYFSQPIFVAGAGNAAAVTALALAAAGCSVVLEGVASRAPKPHKNADWQRVLALSATSQKLLQRLGIWARLDLPSSTISAMQIYGQENSPALALDAHDLDMRAQNTELAQIVSLNALSRAIAQQLADCLAAKHPTITRASSAFADWRAPLLYLADGSQMRGALLVDTISPAQKTSHKWRDTEGLTALRYDYRADALVARLASTKPHNNIARQIFLPTGALALLPLPQPHALALIWSLPRAHAQALASAKPHIFAYELNKICRDFADIGRLVLPNASTNQRATQPLRLHLASQFIAPQRVLLGEAAHIIHPLAGQGFNVTLRDAAALADTLYDAQILGLSVADPMILQNYQSARRADAALLAATTHALAGLFATTPRLASVGLAATHRQVMRQPKLAARFYKQANYGATPPPRLMRNADFAAPLL